MFEKRLAAISPQLLTANGTVNGVITVADAHEFKVKQLVYLTANTLPNLSEIEVKSIVDAGHGITPTQIIVGPKTGNIKSTVDVSAYTVALGAAIQANEQHRPLIPFEETTRAVYEEEPTVAYRVFPVDEMGNDYDEQNPFPVKIKGLEVVAGDLDVQLSHLDDDPNVGDIHDSIRIGDGTDELLINPDGSINVVTTSTSPVPTTPIIANVAAPLANTEYSYTVPTAVKMLFMRTRDGIAKTQFAFAPGDTATNYITIWPGSSHEMRDLRTSVGLTVYFRTSKPNQILEFLVWN